MPGSEFRIALSKRSDVDVPLSFLPDEGNGLNDWARLIKKGIQEVGYRVQMQENLQHWNNCLSFLNTMLPPLLV